MQLCLPPTLPLQKLGVGTPKNREDNQKQEDFLSKAKFPNWTLIHYEQSNFFVID